MIDPRKTHEMSPPPGSRETREIHSSLFVPVRVINDQGSILPYLDYFDSHNQLQKLSAFPLVPLIRNWTDEDVPMVAPDSSLATIIHEPILLWQIEPSDELNPLVGAYLAYLDQQEKQPHTKPNTRRVKPVVDTLVMKATVPHNKGDRIVRTFEASYNIQTHTIELRWLPKPPAEYFNAPKLHDIVNRYQAVDQTLEHFLARHGFLPEIIPNYIR